MCGCAAPQTRWLAGWLAGWLDPVRLGGGPVSLRHRGGARMAWGAPGCTPPLLAEQGTH